MSGLYTLQNSGLWRVYIYICYDMKAAVLVFLGGGLGSVLRFFIGKSLNNYNVLPSGTFLVNVLGSFLIGIVLGLVAKNTTITQQYVLFFATGFCGGFTTFSAFAYENYTFLKERRSFCICLVYDCEFWLGSFGRFSGTIWSFL